MRFEGGMNDHIVSARDLSKTYKVYTRPVDRLIEGLLRRGRHTPFSALRGIDFEAPKGEGLGIIGENGAGKSTLLKILAGITAPTSGNFRLEGSVASILELGSAFHGEFTGRQNIVLNAAMFGLDRQQVNEHTPGIIEFSELGRFIDQPIKTYSTGMVMRLGFAIAIQVDPDVLIIDEALSVGDGYFQKKCMVHLKSYVKNGGTLLICSHAMYYISAFCKRALWLHEGRVEALGPTQEVIPRYEAYLDSKTDRAEESPEIVEAVPTSPARIDDVRLLTGDTYRHKGALELEISWSCDDPEMAFHLGVGLNRPDEVEVASFLSHRSDSGPWTGKTHHTVRLEIPELPLVKNTFKLYVFLLAEDGLHIYDTRILEDAFSVEYDDYPFGIVAIPHQWRVVGNES
jgi:ABC-type polysaccharide/polyol phosphate transport system ATPase subunit